MFERQIRFKVAVHGVSEKSAASNAETGRREHAVTMWS